MYFAYQNLFGRCCLIWLLACISGCNPEKVVGVQRVPLSASNAHIIHGVENGSPILMVIDTGIPVIGEHNSILNAVHRQGFSHSDVKYIFITHAHIDHYGSAHELRALTGAKIIIHEADADDMSHGHSRIGDISFITNDNQVTNIVQPMIEAFVQPTPPDIIVRDGDSLLSYGFDANVIHLPGHTDGHSGLTFRDNGVLVAFSGDLTGNDLTEPYVQFLFANNWSLIPASLEKLKALQPAYVFSSHGAPFSNEVLQGLSPRFP